jgi:hypothetical protein
VTLAAATAAAALAAHSLVDFDWSYPANLASAGIIAALAASAITRRSRRVGSARPVGLLALVALLLVIAVSVPAVWHWHAVDRDSHNGGASHGVTLQRLQHLQGGPFSDARPSVAILRGAETGLYTDPGAIADAYRRTKRVAAVDPAVAALRARALLVLGRSAEAAAAASHLLTAIGSNRDIPLVDSLVVTLALSGERAAAWEALAPRLATTLSDTGNARAIWGHIAAADRAGLLTDEATTACMTAQAQRRAGSPPPNLPVGLRSSGPPAADCPERLEALTR